MEYECIPQDDMDCFYNSKWKSTQITSRASINNFTIIQEKINEEMYKFISSDGSTINSDFIMNKMIILRDSYYKRYYYSRIFKDLIEEINKVYDSTGLIDTISHLVKMNIPTLFTISVSSNYQEPNIYVLQIDDMPLTLESPEKYKNETDDLFLFIDVLSKVYSYIKNNWDYEGSAKKDFIKNIITIEILFASQVLSLEESSNPHIVSNSLRYSDFVKKFGRKIWTPIIETYSTPDSFIRYTNSKFLLFFQNFIDKIDDKQIQMLKDYLIFCIVRNYGSYLEISKIINQLYLKNTEEKNIFVNLFYHTFGPYLEKNYDNKYFNVQKKEKLEDMFHKMKYYCIAYFENTDIFTQDTKKEAIKKLEKMDIIIGSRKHDIDLSKMPQLNDNFYVNLMEIDSFYFRKMTELIGKNINRYALADDKNIYSFIINAYYSPIHNIIYLPTSITDDFFVNINENISGSSLLYNYGGIGSIMGHEMMHCFDKHGAMYDSNGHLKNWWTEKDYQRFDEEIQKVINHYNSISYNGTKLKSEANIGENMADIGGIKISLGTYLRNYEPAINISELKQKADLELFFKRWAEIFRSKTTDEYIRHMIMVDQHAPGIVRINVPFSHIPEYYEIYNVGKNNQNYLSPEKRTILMNYEYYGIDFLSN